MEFDVFGPGTAAGTAVDDDTPDDETADDDVRDCLFVLGWGNRPHYAPVRWLADRLVDDGWRVHTATLPLHVTDVERE